MLYIIRKEKSDYLDYIMEPLAQREDVRILTLNDRRGGKANGLLKDAWLSSPWLRPLLSKRVFGKALLEGVAQIKPDDKVLLFDIWNLKYQRALRLLLGRERVSSFIWDSVSAFYKSPIPLKKYQDALGKYGLRIYTFDPRDAQMYGFAQVPQVYRKAAESGSKTLPLLDACYVGQEAGRGQAIAMLQELLQSEGLKHKFVVVGPGEKGLSYAQYLDLNRQSKAIVELLKPEQTGWTLRTLEALFGGKKLITNNPAIMAEPFYRAENIYVVGHDKRTIREFLEAPMQPVPEALTEQYDIENWIWQFEN